MITYNGTSIQSVYFNTSGEATVRFNGTEVFNAVDDATPVTLSVINGGLYTNKANRIETSNERAYALLFLQTSNNRYMGDIGVSSAVTWDSLSPNGNFRKTPLFYLDDGTYFLAIRKANGYTGGRNWGRELMTLTFSSETLSDIYSAKTIVDYQYDHSSVERIYNERGFTKLHFVPKEGSQSVSGAVMGMAYNVAEISGLTTYVYDESFEKEVKTVYTISAETLFPKNAEPMASAELTIQNKLSPIRFNITENTYAKPRIGYVKVISGKREAVRWMFVQESNDVKFAFFGSSYSAVVDTNLERVVMIDLSKHGETMSIPFRSVSKMVLFEGFADRMVVKKENGEVISPVKATWGGYRFDTYSTYATNNIYTFNIEIL